MKVRIGVPSCTREETFPINLHVILRYSDSVVSRDFLGMPVHIATVYLNGTEESSLWLEAFLVSFLEFIVFRLT